MTKNTKIPTIVTIGKGTQDVFLKSDEFDPQLEGKVAYTHLPLGAKLEVEETIFATGGNATNVAVTLARQGLHARYMWALGHDAASEAVLKELDQEGVDTSYVIQDAAYRAGYGSVLLAPTGERTILSYHGVGPKLTANSLDLTVIDDVDWVYPSALNSFELLEKVVTVARQAGARVMFNPDSKELSRPDMIKPLLEDIEVLCLNKEEMQLLVEGDSLEELVRHGLHYCPVVIVSDGPNGVVASDGKTMVRAGMYEDVPVIDRTGAGDAFASGFLSQWSQGRSLKQSVLFASANSTSVVTRIGAKPGILDQSAELHDMDIKETEL